MVKEIIKTILINGLLAIVVMGMLACTKASDGFGKISDPAKDNTATTPAGGGGTTVGPQAAAPVLLDLVISAFDSTSVTLQKPGFSVAGYPAPTVVGYIGIDGTIGFSGSSIINSTEGPIDLTTGGYKFNSLTASTAYNIIVSTENASGKFIKQITQTTAP